jgi:hypothetical protein
MPVFIEDFALFKKRHKTRLWRFEKCISPNVYAGCGGVAV